LWNAAAEAERLKSNYEQLQQSSSAEQLDLEEKIYKLRNELQDSKDHMAAEQIVLGRTRTIIILAPSCIAARPRGNLVKVHSANRQ